MQDAHTMKIRIRLTDETYRDFQVDLSYSDAEDRAEFLMRELEEEGKEILDYSIGEDWETFDKI